MGIRLPEMMVHAKQSIRRWSSHSKHRCSYKTSSAANVQKGHFAVYVGDEVKKKKFVVPLSYLNHPLFQALLKRAEEEFGFDHHPVDNLMVPCAEDEFIKLTYRINHASQWDNHD